MSVANQSIFTASMTSNSTGESRGRLATPKTRREEMVWSPETSRSNSDAASATFGCPVNAGVAAMYTPSLTTWFTRFNAPHCFFVSASTLSAARLYIKVFAYDANHRRRCRGGEHPAQEQEVAHLNSRRAPKGLGASGW